MARKMPKRYRRKIDEPTEPIEADILKEPSCLSATQTGTHNPYLLPALSKRYTDEQISDVIVRSHGLTSSICKALDCTTQQYYVFLRKRPELKALQDESRLDLVNDAEAVMMDNLHNEDPVVRADAAKYILNRLGRTRGWGEDKIFGITVSQDEQTKQVHAIFGIAGDSE